MKTTSYFWYINSKQNNMQKITGKQIEAFAQTDLKAAPKYYKNYYLYNPCNHISTRTNKFLKPINGALIAGKYNSIVALVKETGGQVEISEQKIKIIYQNGSCEIGRDLFVDTFLLPNLK